MSELEPPKIEFPCRNYPIKVMGEASSGFRAFVEGVMSKHDEDFDAGTVQVRPSRNGRYESVNVMITATGIEQLNLIFVDLKANPAVRMVL